MNTTEQTAKASHTATGLLALLRGALRLNGTGASFRVARRAFPAGFVALLIVAFTSAPALAERQHVFERAFGAGEVSLRGSGQEVAGSGVAVDSASHDVYVADTQNHRVDEFAPDGSFVRAWGWGVGLGIGFEQCTSACQPGISGTAPGQFEAPAFIAVDNSGGPSEGDVYVGDTGDNIVTKFTETGALVKSWGTEGQLNGSTATGPVAGPFGSLVGIAVDSSGTLDVLQTGSPGVLFQFAQSGAFTTDFETPRGSLPAGLAVDAQGDFFKVDGSGAVEEIKPSGEDIGQVTKEINATDVAFDPSTDELYVDSASRTYRYAFNGAGEVLEPGTSACKVEPESNTFSGCNQTESFGSGTLTGGAGLGVDSSNANVYVADVSTNRIDLFTLEPPSAPIVENESVSEVTNDSAKLHGDVNPHGVSSEPATEYQFEYITEAAYQANLQAALPAFAGAARAPVAAGSVSPTFEDETVSPVIAQGLLAGTVYHYRLTARNQNGVAEGERGGQGEEIGHTFSTSPKGEFALPDGRQWEMVSPPNKHGALIEPIGEAWVIQAAANGDAITYVADAPTESNPEGYVVFQQVLSTRGLGDWSSRDIEPPHTNSTNLSIGNGQEFRFFSEDLSSAVVQPFGAFDPADSAEASEQTAFRRTNFPAESPGEVCTGACLQPLVTGAPGFANVPAGTPFGNEAPCTTATVSCGPRFVGGTPGDLSHVILESVVPLKANAVERGLYEWSAGKPAGEQLSLVSVLPDGKASSGGLGTENSSNTRGAVSEDGSRVVWVEGANSHLYLRVNAREPQSPVSGGVCTIAADACSVELDEGLSGAPEFQLASKGVAGVLFTDAGDLYEYVVGEHHLRRLTENAEVLGSVIGASPDNSLVYFVAQGVLGDASEHGAAQGDCKPGGKVPSQRCNLYVSHNGVVQLVAVLSGADFPDWAFGGIANVLNELTARVSPDGEWLAFMSERGLTGYDNRDAVSGQPDEEVFEYSAASGRVVCASCDPTGARPHGVEYGKEGDIAAGEEMRLAGGDAVWPGSTWLAANVPSWTPYSLVKASYQSRYLSDSGRLFFNARDGLVSKDVNGQGDVYEFEPEGVPAGEHACSSASTSGSEVFEPVAAGCVALISSGTSATESAFLDASESGGDVFFLTTGKLVPQDGDSALDIYDAQECTGEVPCQPAAAVGSPPCSTEASCKAAPSPQPEIFGPSGSATFSGVGNIAPAVAPPSKKVTKKAVKCKKGFVKSKKGKCLRKQKPKRAKKSARANRRASR